MYSTSTLICRTRITPPSPFKKGLGRVCHVLFSQLRSVQHCYACLSLRATRRRGKSKLKRPTPLSGELTSMEFDERPISLPFQRPLHPMNRFAHKHGKVEKADAATKPGRHGRARSLGEGGVLRCSKRLVISTGNHALRGPVNWGAEKKDHDMCRLGTVKNDSHKTRTT